MNPAEQATHRTKTAHLDHRLNNLETVVDELGRYTADVSQWAPVITKRLELHGTTLQALTANVQRLDTQLEAFTDRTLWQRLRWLVTGR